MDQRCSNYFQNNASKEYVLISHTLKYMGRRMTRKTTLLYVFFLPLNLFSCVLVFSRDDDAGIPPGK